MAMLWRLATRRGQEVNAPGLRALVSQAVLFHAPPVPAMSTQPFNFFHGVRRSIHSSAGWLSGKMVTRSGEFPMSGALFRASFVNRRSLFVNASTEEVALQYLSGTEEGIAVLTLNRPQARNAIGQELLSKLRTSIESLQFQNSARILLVCSTVSGVFCAGADLKERRKLDLDGAYKYFQVLRSTLTALENLSIPTIAVIEGAALGGGLELALACDLRICGDEAVFGFPETGHGIIPGAGGTQRLPRIIGRARALELIFTGRRIDGQKAEEIGLVNHCVQAGNAFQKALDIAQEIKKQGPLALKLAKVAIGRGSEVDIASGMVIEEACYVQTFKSKDRLEGLAAFAEKRKPVYSGE